MTKKPRVLIPSNIVQSYGLPAHHVRDTFIDALADLDCTPLILPVTLSGTDLKELSDMVDGIVLTGSPSNVAPACYGAEQVFADEDLDLIRDATTLPLIRAAIDMDIPLLAICRGFQELNVATGGSLHQRVQTIPGMMDHREKEGAPLKEAYETLAHSVHVEKGGLLEQMGLPSEFMVNTLHQQGVDRLGGNLRVEARAPDGLIEAVSVPAKKFILGTQWHPEGNYRLDRHAQMIFQGFRKSLGC